MHISQLRIKNYKSFDDTGNITLAKGFNVIVGQNNAGKTAFLEALSSNYDNKPHKSLRKLPKSTSVITDLQSEIELNFILAPNEMSDIYASARFGESNIPLQGGRNLEETAKILNDRLSDELEISCTIRHNQIIAASIQEFDQGKSGRVKYDLNKESFILVDTQIRPIHFPEMLPVILSSILRNRVYTFRAERQILGKSIVSENTILASNASNLAQVLHTLQTTNRSKFDQYLRLVTEVLPQVKSVTTPPSGTDAQILIWSLDESSQRNDLAIPLTDSGTGIGQVLAILYVVVNSPYPQSILIDEPQSFLHPGAARNLMQILRQYPLHQYLVSTHSPSIISSISPSKLLKISRIEMESTVESIDPTDLNVLSGVLADVGAKISDVFGSDSVLWVEGATEEVCFRRILDFYSPNSYFGVDIIGVRNVSEIEKKHGEVILEIYRKLCKGRGLLPPAIGFIFDLEERTQIEISDLQRRGGKSIHFLRRRMFENYLLEPNGIAAIINTIHGFRESNVSDEEVKLWFIQNGLKKEYLSEKKGVAVFDNSWYERVHGAKVLDALFTDLSETRVKYNKVEHGAMLTDWLLQHTIDHFKEISDVLEDVLASETREF